MKYFIAAVPLFNTEMAVEAYHLSYQNGEKLFGLSQNHLVLDEAMNSPAVDILNRIGIEAFTGGRPIFMSVNKFMLLADSVKSCRIAPENIVCVIGKDTPPDQMYFDKLEDLKSRGYRLALNNIDFTHESAPLFVMADILMIDTYRPFKDKLKNLRIRLPKTTILLTNIANKAMFDELRQTKNALFEGRFYNEPLTEGVKEVSALKTNALQLLKLIGDDDFDLDDASKVISRDAALSISLLKFINSPAIGITSKVNSIQTAVALLGQKETKKWVNAAVSTYLAEDKPNEISRLSLVRAKFAENLAGVFHLGIHGSSLFLMGLFSLLDVILDMPMKDAVNEVPLNDKIREALVDGRGPFNEVLRMVHAYEQADWNSVSHIMITHNINLEELNQSFMNALVWYRDLIGRYGFYSKC